MKPSWLLIISSDPRKSPRPAEAIRIAAGVGAWKKTEVSVYLREAGVLVLSEFPDELMDEDGFIRYLPIISEFGRPVYVQRAASLLTEVGEASLPFEQISDDELAQLAARHDYVATF